MDPVGIKQRYDKLDEESRPKDHPFPFHDTISRQEINEEVDAVVGHRFYPISG